MGSGARQMSSQLQPGRKAREGVLETVGEEEKLEGGKRRREKEEGRRGEEEKEVSGLREREGETIPHLWSGYEAGKRTHTHTHTPPTSLIRVTVWFSVCCWGR